ncbi:MAG: PD-(D/E)XK nuclease family protein [Sporichthyaceae bacterium]
MTVGGSLVFAAPGVPTVAALHRLIHTARSGDALRPVDVVVPSAVAGVTLRRAVAGKQGLANVRFGTLPQLAERLAARHLALAPESLRPMSVGDRAVVVQRVLAAAKGSPLVNAARAQRATARMVQSVLAEFAAARVDPAVVPEGLSTTGTELLGLYGAYLGQVAGLLDRAALYAAAAAAIAAGDAPATHAVLIVQDRLGGAERELVAALASAGRLGVVADGDAPDDVLAFLAGLGAAASAAPAGEPNVERLVVAPDADEEVRIAVRTVVEHLAATGCRPERIGIAYASPVPYLRLLAEQLSVADIPHHVGSQRTLAQSVAGRTLLGLLDVHARDYPRADVLRLLADAPFLDADGHRLPVAAWDRLSRDAGVSRGLATWGSRLANYAKNQRARIEPDMDTERSAPYEDRAARAEALLAEVERFARATAQTLQAGSWAEAGTGLAGLLETALGGRRRVDGWAYGAAPALGRRVGIEQDAHDAVLAELGALAELDGTGVPCTAAAIAGAVADRLDVSMPTGTTLGRGVMTGTIADFAGADLDVLLVLGATESALPARQREHVLLRDGDRALLSPELATVASRRADQRAKWRLALSGAASVRISYPRADSRGQRRQFASPWFLEQATRLAGTTVSAKTVDDAELTAPWFVSHASFESATLGTTVHAHLHELDVARALSGGVAALAAHDPRLARGLEAAGARTRGDFSEWTGAVGPLPADLRARVDAGLSATNLQKWAACPASHLYEKVLGVRDLEDPGAADTIDAAERGSFVHAVLEDLVLEHLPADGRPPLPSDRAWSKSDVARALDLLETKAAELSARGVTGREIVWKVGLAKLARMVPRVLAQDSARRRTMLAHPIAVEADFGRNGVDPLVVELPTQGPVVFAGSIDRVDSTVGGGLVVIDYKTGRGNGYDAIPKQAKASADANLVDGGRKLQLVLYALAARQLHGLPEASVESWFWFVETGELRGGPVTHRQEQQLKDALDVVVAGIRGGVYPANPGLETWAFGAQTWSSCTYCPFDLVCPTSRAEQWNGLRLDPAVKPYDALSNPGEVQA